jgi:hypothetical protein
VPEAADCRLSRSFSPIIKLISEHKIGWQLQYRVDKKMLIPAKQLEWANAHRDLGLGDTSFPHMGGKDNQVE